MGFLAAARGDVLRAEVIFGALLRLRPARNFGYVGLAMCYLNVGKPDDAVRVLDQGALLVEPDDRAELDSFRGLALQLAGRAGESRRAVQQAGGTRLAAAMRGDPALEP